MARSQSNNLHIALLLNRESVYGRGVIQGVMAFARPSRTWKVSIGRLDLKNLHKVIALQPDGIIAEVFTPHAVDLLKASGIPFVDVSNIVDDPNLHTVCSDNLCVGQIAAEHFQERGFAHFAYFGGTSAHFAQQREVGFQSTLEKCGQTCSILRKKLKLDFYGSNVLGESSDRIGTWLESLPKPVALFACNDAFALILNESCQQLGLSVPDEVAILGVDNDEQFCQLETPTLSSIELPTQQIGFEAAKVLEQVIHQKNQSPQTLRIPPISIQQRQSTDIIAMEDQQLAEALRYIRENADKPITVEDICERLCMSRRSLETRIKKQLGHSPLTEIHRVHIQKAKTLLMNTDMQISAIARASGFNSPESMSVIFKKYTGHTPTNYRKQGEMSHIEV